MAKKWRVGDVVTGSIPRGRIPVGARWEMTGRNPETRRPSGWRLVDRGADLREGPPLFDNGTDFLEREKPNRFVPPTFAAMVSGALDDKQDREDGDTGKERK